MAKAARLVVDSGAFLKNADIRSMGETIYSIKEVVTEIKDKATRQRLAFLPYQINFQKPSPESIQKIMEVSKRTGDYPSLSLVDIQVLALTYELAKQYDPECLTEECIKTKSDYQFGASVTSQEVILPGFYMPPKSKGLKNSSLQHDEDPQNEGNMGDEMTTDDGDKGDAKEEGVDVPQEVDEDVCMVEIGDGNENGGEVMGVEETSEDDEGWITPGNIKQLQQESAEVAQNVTVACVTTDFAMQNVLMKMGLTVFSVDGMQIRSVRSYVLRCHACFHITKIMTKLFCPKCGNNTLKRVPTSVQPDGSVKYYLSKNPRVLNKKGKKVSLPLPRGGKHAYNPILCEDQPVAQNRMSRKAMQKTNVWSDDYAIDGNPFAVNETESRSFKLGFRQNGSGHGRRRNPNAVGRKFVKKR